MGNLRFTGGAPRAGAIAALPCACTSLENDSPAERLSFGPFHELRIYRPPRPAQHLALLLPGDGGGWGAPLPEIARRLSGQGTLIAGIDVRELFSRYQLDPQSCVSPGADLADLAHDLRQRYALSDAAPQDTFHRAAGGQPSLPPLEPPVADVRGGLARAQQPGPAPGRPLT